MATEEQDADRVSGSSVSRPCFRVFTGVHEKVCAVAGLNDASRVGYQVNKHVHVSDEVNRSVGIWPFRNMHGACKGKKDRRVREAGQIFRSSIYGLFCHFVH